MKNKTSLLTINALSIALVCITTMWPQIPIPLGYMHLGNTLILLVAFYFGPVTGLLAGGVGSALADLLTGYAMWCLPTLIIKGIMGFAIGFIAHKNGRIESVKKMSTVIGSIVGIVVMIVGYFIGGSILYGSIAVGATQIPGLTFEGVLGMAIFFILAFSMEKAKVPRLIEKIERNKG